LPPVEDLQAAARRWGLSDGDSVVVYDDLGNMSAARAWWLLRHAGVENVRLLDGALGAWRAAGLDVEVGGEEVEPGSISLAYGTLATVSIDEVGDVPQSGVLLDARAPERFRGEIEPVDPRAGHIPGARNTPTGGNLDADGRFLAPEVLRARFAEVGVTTESPVVSYCGSGVTAAHNIVALTLAGFEVALYPGSWSEWSNHPELPIERDERTRA
jgi:thiosulfate/3-mercaptopyruvate sulfurtransferase